MPSNTLSEAAARELFLEKFHNFRIINCVKYKNYFVLYPELIDGGLWTDALFSVDRQNGNIAVFHPWANNPKEFFAAVKPQLTAQKLVEKGSAYIHRVPSKKHQK